MSADKHKIYNKQVIKLLSLMAFVFKIWNRCVTCAQRELNHYKLKPNVFGGPPVLLEPQPVQEYGVAHLSPRVCVDQQTKDKYVKIILWSKATEIIIVS